MVSEVRDKFTSTLKYGAATRLCLHISIQIEFFGIRTKRFDETFYLLVANL
jgi:hypothetical protein